MVTTTPKYFENPSTELKSICKHFVEAGLKVYLVGGFVRDTLSGSESKDYDFATPHTPEEIIEALEPNVIDLTENSSQFGTVFLQLEGQTVEITTFRKDITRGRQPEVDFTTSLLKDSERRDFTINSIYIDVSDWRILDPHAGKFHIKKSILHSVGSSFNRLSEDPLRILRAVRFMAKGYEPTKPLEEAIKKASALGFLEDISVDRIREEFLKILETDVVKGLKYLKKYKLLKQIHPHFEELYGYDQGIPEYHKWGLFNHSVLTAKKFTNQYSEKTPGYLILIAFLHDIGKPIAMAKDGNYYNHDDYGAKIIKRIFEDLNFSNKETRTAEFLVKHHMRLHQDHTTRNILKTKHLCKKAGMSFVILFRLWIADLWGSRFEVPSDSKRFNCIDLWLPKNPIDGYDCIDLLKSFGSNNHRIIGDMIDRSWEMIYKKPKIIKSEILIRLEDYLREVL